MSEQEHESIFLQPWCDGCEKMSCAGDGRLWCQDDVWSECEECDRKSVKYVHASAIDRITADLRKSEEIIQQYREDSARDERVNNELRAAIDRITSERDGLLTKIETMAQIAKARRDKCDALTAERDGLRKALENARTEIVVAIAFLRRDAGTDRMIETVMQITDILARRDDAIRAALATSDADKTGVT